ncbi:hypothetical protein [Phormidium sp. CCY1219]|nr:hypothetical protein [Phormidium sp. CCY1219]
MGKGGGVEAMGDMVAGGALQDLLIAEMRSRGLLKADRSLI